MPPGGDILPPPYQDSLKHTIKDILRCFEPKLFQVSQVIQDVDASMKGSGKCKTNITKFLNGFIQSHPQGGVKDQQALQKSPYRRFTPKYLLIRVKREQHRYEFFLLI